QLPMSRGKPAVRSHHRNGGCFKKTCSATVRGRIGAKTCRPRRTAACNVKRSVAPSSSTAFFLSRGGGFCYRLRDNTRRTLGRGYTANTVVFCGRRTLEQRIKKSALLMVDK